MRIDTGATEEQKLTRPAATGLPFIVGFFFSFRIIITIFSVRMLGANPETGAEIRLAFNFFLLAVVCFAVLGTPARTGGSMLQLSTMRWALIFLVFSGCSLLWGENASLIASAAYWCGTVSDVLIVVLLLRGVAAEETANFLMQGFIWASCLIALIAWIMPAQYDLRLGDEDFFNSNSIGNLCAFGVLFAQYLMRRKAGKWGFAAVFLAITLVRSLSKTAIVAFVVCESFLLIQDRQMSRRTKLLLTTSVVLVILAFWGLFEAYYNFYTSYGNEAETLTGRTAIWAYVVDAALQHLWIGHGFDSMWKVVPPFGAFEARHAENELLEQFYSYGIAGIVMLCGVYGSLYASIRKLAQSPVKPIFTSILLYVIVRGFAEAEPFDLLLPLWMIVMLSLLIEYERLTSGHAAVTFPIEQFEWTSPASSSPAIPADL